jgi:hypothetical protein
LADIIERSRINRVSRKACHRGAEEFVARGNDLVGACVRPLEDAVATCCEVCPENNMAIIVDTDLAGNELAVRTCCVNKGCERAFLGNPEFWRIRLRCD